MPPHAPLRLADTILTWQEPETGADLALSFQEDGGCAEIWCARSPGARARATAGRGPRAATDGRCAGPRPRRSRIQRVQGSADDDTDKLSGDENTEPLHGARSPFNAPPGDALTAATRPTVAAADRSTLPEPKVDNLPQLAEILQQASFATRDSIVAAMTERGYLESLLQLFSDLEDLEDKDGVAALFGVFKALRACARARRAAPSAVCAHRHATLVPPGAGTRGRGALTRRSPPCPPPPRAVSMNETAIFEDVVSDAHFYRVLGVLERTRARRAVRCRASPVLATLTSSHVSVAVAPRRCVACLRPHLLLALPPARRRPAARHGAEAPSLHPNRGGV